MNTSGKSSRQWPGSPYPLGATWDGMGVNFALFSEHATGVELCLFDSPDAQEESERVRFTEYTDHVWSMMFGPSTSEHELLRRTKG